MALQPLSPHELADTPTLFASFMGHADASYKTVGQLLSIYRQRRDALRAGEDRADDLRVDRFMSDMARHRWKAGVVVRIGVFDDKLFVIDGIHRGIAYLACLQDGISTDRLPALQVSC
jgi:aminoglycoside/choline kinase family phosphotransferase